MPISRGRLLFAGAVIAVSVSAGVVSAQLPDTIAAAGGTVVATMLAEGAQVYECKADAGGRLTWQFREPIATLLLDGKTVGRNYAGPSWEHGDGSVLVGRVVGRAPGAGPRDIPWLKLEVTEHRGSGFLSSVTTIQRINTQGGAAEGACDTAGAYLSVAYVAEYVFLRR